MSFDFKQLESKYQQDPAFNRMVTVFVALIRDHGFMPSEMREGMFFAQWMYEMKRVERIVRTQTEWQQIYEARELLKERFSAFTPEQIQGIGKDV